MQNIASVKELKDAISVFEKKQSEQLTLLKKQFGLAIENLKPLNIIKNTLNEATKSNNFIVNILSSSIGLFVSYFSKKLFIGKSDNIFKKISGSFLQLIISKFLKKIIDTNIVKNC